ncbi:ParB/RepB/Spo0J family partition protein [Amycolatopsis sp. WGS_07]|uniref:ParB/RepB/Spo0J family partition protein n=1 Tax=Amycolatopsis sp. WGS_07 TaxID=3076764 RepID=UPI0038733BF5
MVSVGSLRPADSPRIGGEDGERVRELAELDGGLPPIVVHRATMRVIDGMHRLRAALLRGEKRIEVRFYEGTEADAFVLAVRLNASHGLPLTQVDRAAAAARILDSHPQWSDRAIASVTGLSHKTVGSIRKRATGEVAHSSSRMGQDGRVRPLDAAEGRIRATELIARKPDASLREIARESGVSLGTARDVRERVRANQDPLPRRQRRGANRVGNVAASGGLAGSGSPAVRVRDPVSALEILRKDPALRQAELGRGILRLLDAHSISPSDWEQFSEIVPPHCRDTVSGLARECARSWVDFARRLEDRSRLTGSSAENSVD